jgi:serine/threonine protein kinase
MTPLPPGTKNNAYALDPGYQLGGYRIVRDIGSGGFGITYLATCEESPGVEIKVAIKELFPMDFVIRSGTQVVLRNPDDAESLEVCHRSFYRECKILRDCAHPNVVRTFDHFEWNGTVYLVMEYLEDGTLTDYLEKHPDPLAERHILEIFAPILDAVESIHRLGYLHRDIAPDNILLSDGFPILVDFGCAKGEADARLRGANTGVVKARYSPFEQYTQENSQLGPWSDIYSLASMLHFLVTRDLPPESPSRIRSSLPGSTEPDPYQPLVTRKRRLSGYSEALLAAVDWGLAVKPEDRPQSIAEWRRALPPLPTEQLLLRDLPSGDEVPSPPSSRRYAGTLRLSPRPPGQFHYNHVVAKLAVVLALIVAMLIAAGVVIHLLSR